MPGNRLSLSRINLPPDLAQSIISTGGFYGHFGGPRKMTSSIVRESEVASAATLVGDTSTTPLTKPPVPNINTSAILPADCVLLQFDDTAKGTNTVGPTRPHNAQQPLITSQPRLILLKPSDSGPNVFYDRQTDEFFTAVPETRPDGSPDEEDEEQNPLLKEASRLAHSVRIISPRNICHANCSLQTFDEDWMETDTETGPSASTAARKSHHSTSTARPGQGDGGEDDVSSQVSRATGESDEDAGMSDQVSNGNGGSHGAASPREDGEVRTSKSVFSVLTCTAEPLCDIRRYKIPRFAYSGWSAGCCEPDNRRPEGFKPRFFR